MNESLVVGPFAGTQPQSSTEDGVCLGGAPIQRSNSAPLALIRVKMMGRGQGRLSPSPIAAIAVQSEMSRFGRAWLQLRAELPCLMLMEPGMGPSQTQTQLGRVAALPSFGLNPFLD